MIHENKRLCITERVVLGIELDSVDGILVFHTVVGHKPLDNDVVFLQVGSVCLVLNDVGWFDYMLSTLFVSFRLLLLPIKLTFFLFCAISAGSKHSVTNLYISLLCKRRRISCAGFKF
jgi:hypothetical protein